MSGDEAHIPPEEPIEPILLPENPFASPRGPWEPVGAPPEPIVWPRPPRVWPTIVVLVGAFVLNFVVVGVLLVALTVTSHGPDSFHPSQVGDVLMEVSTSPVGMLSTTSATMILFAGAAAGAAALSPVPWKQRLRLGRPTISPLGMLAQICGVLGIGLVFSSLLALELLPKSLPLAELSNTLAGESGVTLAAFVLVIGIAPGFAEEALFRGYAQTRFSRRWGPGVGVFLTSVAFGVMHMDLVWGMFAFSLGLYLGHLTERTGSILPAIVCHAGNNVFSVLATAWYVDYEGVPANVAALVGGFVLVAAALWHLHAFVKPAPSDTP